MSRPRFFTVLTMIFIAALSRLLPHPWNVSPVAGMALFSGAHFSRKGLAFVVPLAAMLVSDALIGFYPEIWVVYGSLCLIVLMGTFLRSHKGVAPVGVAALAGSVLFFILTNFVMWIYHYPHTGAGLTACYVAALPFFQNTLLGDLFYTGVLFGVMAVAERKSPALREAALA
ncbi:MAG: hypothetical protein LHV69_09940 [Elusimicrobia bacterium]|nr:hypothetical protein [Candidatus Obscuribacterium magneticum]